jgi:hypothetical protein
VLADDTILTGDEFGERYEDVAEYASKGSREAGRVKSIMSVADGPQCAG